MNLHDAAPQEVRKLIARGEITQPTAGMCGGYAQANLVILPEEYAGAFEVFAMKNPRSCPVLEIAKRTPYTTVCGKANLLTDLPKYRIWRNGKLDAEVTDITQYWSEDMWCFLLGCSFSFEEALLQNGIELRHVTEGCNVPMYKTTMPMQHFGAFRGPLVVSMRPIKKEQVELACDITARFPRVHGAPVFIGNPEEIGIKDLSKPDYGDAVTIKEGEVPVFWACGVTPQASIEMANLPLVITHSPGHMFITDLTNESLAKTQL